ncbi:hypothetical protein ACHAPT_005831 [Fusarium lateritium]
MSPQAPLYSQAPVSTSETSIMSASYILSGYAKTTDNLKLVDEMRAGYTKFSVNVVAPSDNPVLKIRELSQEPDFTIGSIAVDDLSLVEAPTAP